MKLTLASTGSGYDLTPLNNNFTLLEQELQNNILYRDNPAGEPNQMEQSLDMNSNTVYNLPDALESSQAVPFGQLNNIIQANSSGLVARLRETRKVAAQNQTLFTLSDITYYPGASNLQVYINGVAQVAGIDYEETSDSSITFLTGLEAGDVVDVYTNETTSTTNADLVLRHDLKGDPSEGLGAALVKGSVINVESVADLLAVTQIQGTQVSVAGYHPDTSAGGGEFYFDESVAKSEHDGATVISPTCSWDGGEADLLAFLDKTNEADAQGTGCFIRKRSSHYRLEDFGATDSVSAATGAQIGATFIKKCSEDGLPGVLPLYRLNTDKPIPLKSNILIIGQGQASGFIGSSWVGATFEILSCVKDDGPYENISLQDFYVEGADKSTTRSGSNIRLTNIINANLSKIKSVDGSDACIRVDGYGTGAFIDDPENVFWNNSFDIVLEDCITVNGFLGIELEGGAQRVSMRNPYVLNPTSHGIRLASAYDVDILGGSVVGFGSTGIYLDRHFNIFIGGGIKLNSTKASSDAGITIAGFDRTSVSMISENVTISDVTFLGETYVPITDNYTGSTNKYTTGLFVSGVKDLTTNGVGGKIFATHDYSRDIFYRGNYSKNKEFRAFSNLASGMVVDNFFNIGFSSTYPNLLQNGGGKLYMDRNIDPNTSRPELLGYQSQILGSATSVPTSGTFDAGSIIFKNYTTVSAGDYIGWVCTSRGTLSTATDSTGETDGATGVISGMSDTSDFSVGEYVTVSAGFPSSSESYQILNVAPTSITIVPNSTSVQSGVTVSTTAPVFKTFGGISA